VLWILAVSLTPDPDAPFHIRRLVSFSDLRTMSMFAPVPSAFLKLTWVSDVEEDLMPKTSLAPCTDRVVPPSGLMQIKSVPPVLTEAHSLSEITNSLPSVMAFIDPVVTLSIPEEFRSLEKSPVFRNFIAYIISIANIQKRKAIHKYRPSSLSVS
jgi:hypothetical protein